MTGERFEKLLRVLQHCVGHNGMHPTFSPNEGRNYVCAAGTDLPLCRELSEMGLMTHGQTTDEGWQYFYATAKGLEVGRMPACHGCDHLWSEE